MSRAWYKVLGREPSKDELEDSLRLCSNAFRRKSSDDDGRLLAWSSLCRTLIASNDFHLRALRTSMNDPTLFDHRRVAISCSAPPAALG